jgi:hypothetical protein
VAFPFLAPLDGSLDCIKQLPKGQFPTCFSTFEGVEKRNRVNTTGREKVKKPVKWLEKDF